MKQIFFSALLMACGIVADAQQLKQPQPGNNLPVPDVKVLKPADIEISQVDIVRAEPVSGTKLHRITVRLSIRNNGEMNTGSFNVQAYVENQLAAPQNARKKLGVPISVQRIDGGKSLSMVMVFTETDRVIIGNRIKLFLVSDFGNRVKESDESNNTTTGILIAL